MNQRTALRGLMVIVAILSITLSLSFAVAEPQYFAENGFYYVYETEENTAKLLSFGMTEGTETPNEIRIPATINGLPLRTIAEYAFSDLEADEYGNGYDGRKVKRLILPEGLEMLEENALGCMVYVECVELPASLTSIGPCFNLCEVRIVISSENPRFRVIDGYLVDETESCLLYTIPNAHVQELPSVRSFGSSSLENYQYDTLVFPGTTEFIGTCTCNDAVNLLSIEIPGSVKEIADDAFYSVAAETVVLHEGIERIGAHAFFDTELETITIPHSVNWLGYAFVDPYVEAEVLNPACIRETGEEYVQRTGDSFSDDW